MEIYGTPGMRRYHDIDLLVERSMVFKAVELLLQDGWSWYYSSMLTTPKRIEESLRLQNHYLFTKGEMCVELHWRLHPWDCDDFEQLWSERRLVKLGGTDITVPGAMHQLHHLVYHASRHGFHRLKWLADLVILLPRSSTEMDNLWQSFCLNGTEVTLLMTWALLLSLPALDIPDAAFGGFTLRRTDSGVQIDAPDDTAGMIRQTQRLLHKLLPLLEAAEDIETSVAYRIYRSMLPDPPSLRGKMRKAIYLLRPRPIVWEWINLPDHLYWLYWPLQPVERILRLFKK